MSIFSSSALSLASAWASRPTYSSITLLTWFNPFIYLIKKEIKAIHEFLADEYAISDNNRYAYAELLVMQSIRNKQSYLLNPFFHNQIKRRITMITKFRNPKKSYMSRLMILPLLFILFCAFAINTNRKKPIVNEIRTITVVIDAGHGGIDAGAKSLTGINEKDLALKISKKIQELSKNYNVKVIMTREKDELPGNASNISDGLRNRTDIAVKNNANLFVSIHMNSTNNPSKSGFQMYISDNNANLLQKNIQLGSILSEEIKKDYEVDDVLIRMNKGVAVLNQSSIPAIIAALGLLWGQTYCSGVMKCPAIAEPAAQHTNYSGPCDAMALVLELINAIHRWNRTYPGGGKIERVIARKADPAKQ